MDQEENAPRTERAKMLAGALYSADDPELVALRAKTIAWSGRYNASVDATIAERRAMLCEIFGAVGEGANIRPPFFVDYGFNITLGAGAFLNLGCTILDAAPVTIGDLAMIGPGVQILTADHPRDPDLRRKMLVCARPVHIGRNVWIGAAALLLPGVSVGDDAIIGAGSVVTRDVAAGATVVGSPARPVPGRG